jgi:hypothetical protein
VWLPLTSSRNLLIVQDMGSVIMQVRCVRCIMASAGTQTPSPKRRKQTNTWSARKSRGRRIDSRLDAMREQIDEYWPLRSALPTLIAFGSLSILATAGAVKDSGKPMVCKR